MAPGNLCKFHAPSAAHELLVMCIAAIEATKANELLNFGHEGLNNYCMLIHNHKVIKQSYLVMYS